MPNKKYKPKTNGFRQREVADYAEITATKPNKSLTTRIKKNSGRNNSGKITVRHKGGGTRRKYRKIDFLRQKDGVAGKVVSIEYDPNRTAYIACLAYLDGEKRYILAPRKLTLGTQIVSGNNVEIATGNALPLEDIPAGSLIHNIEISISGGAKLVRSAGTSATLLAKNDGYAIIKLPSGETRRIHLKCRATIGQVSNMDKRNRVLGKAGASRWKGRRPVVRGSAMNPNDHAHGGGEGKSPIGMSTPKSYTGKKTRGKTRKKPNRFLVLG